MRHVAVSETSANKGSTPSGFIVLNPSVADILEEGYHSRVVLGTLDFPNAVILPCFFQPARV
jgi:hypothetical protein